MKNKDKNILEDKIQFEKDIIKVLKKYNLTTNNIGYLKIECNANSLPIITLIYNKQIHTLWYRIQRLFNYYILRIRIYFSGRSI